MTADQKLPPHKMELRARPQPVTKLSRKVIILGAGGLTALIAGAFLLALQPPKARGETQAKELYNVTTKPVADGLADLPVSYRDVKPIIAPVPDPEPDLLGPPALGDVARAMVVAEQRTIDPPRQDAFASGPVRRTNLGSGRSNLAAARKSDLFFQRSAPQRTGLQTDAQLMAALTKQEGGPDTDFPASGSHKLMAGTLIPASLITGINSDLPGPAMAQITQNVFDSLTGEHLLIPQGAKLIGSYGNQINFGQKRAFISWTRIIFPDGRSISLDDLTASDLAGYSGLSDRVDNRTGDLVKAGILSTVLGVGAELSVQRDDDDVADAIREAIQGTANTAGQKIIQRKLNVKPTITIRPGWTFQVIVTDDIQLSVYGA